jgi:hypothetical protein
MSMSDSEQFNSRHYFKIHDVSSHLQRNEDEDAVILQSTTSQLTTREVNTHYASLQTFRE